MTKKYWFKAKSYGWGWYPATWQGWAVIALYVAINTTLFYKIDSESPTASDTFLEYSPYAFLLIIILIGICYAKGEKPVWRWGKKK